jgi:hypothetical protein
MILKSNNNIESERFGSDWGFYIDIDIENMKTIPKNEDIIRKKYKVIKYYESNKYYNNENIDDIDEYDYYIKNYKSFDDDVSIDKSIDSNDHFNKINYDLVSDIFRVSSTTIITIAITYIVFCVL